MTLSDYAECISCTRCVDVCRRFLLIGIRTLDFSTCTQRVEPCVVNFLFHYLVCGVDVEGYSLPHAFSNRAGLVSVDYLEHVRDRIHVLTRGLCLYLCMNRCDNHVELAYTLSYHFY